MESIVLFCITCWGGNIKNQDKEKIDRVIKKASKVSSIEFMNFDALHTSTCVKKLKIIMEDPSHPLAIQVVKSVRSGRIVHLKCNRERYRKSFMPNSIRLV